MSKNIIDFINFYFSVHVYIYINSFVCVQTNNLILDFFNHLLFILLDVFYLFINKCGSFFIIIGIKIIFMLLFN